MDFCPSFIVDLFGRFIYIVFDTNILFFHTKKFDFLHLFFQQYFAFYTKIVLPQTFFCTKVGKKLDIAINKVIWEILE